jgi:hypothetical protein
MNPDDLPVGTGFNARGVDLNRNFPPNWVSETCGAPGGRYGPTGCKRGGGGSSPFSEPESQAVRALVEGEKLQALLIMNAGISVISSRNGGGGRGEPLANYLGNLLGIRYVPTFAQYPVTGQLVDWVEDAGLIGVEINMPRFFSFERGRQVVQAAMNHLAQ